MLSLVLPAYNEEVILKPNTLKLFNFCQQKLTDDWQIIIANNGSTDKTAQIAEELARRYRQIKYYYTDRQGKGYAVLEAWQNYPADIYAYMDMDLATDLSALPQLIQLIQNGYDISVGSRFAPGAQVQRSYKRKIFSLGLRWLLKILFKLPVKDSPCGFKAVNQKVIDKIVPQIQNRTWFFDTEMLILSQRQGLKIKEIPISWRETTNQARKSKVKISKVIKDYLTNIYSIYGRK